MCAFASPRPSSSFLPPPRPCRSLVPRASPTPLLLSGPHRHRMAGRLLGFRVVVGRRLGALRQPGSVCVQLLGFRVLVGRRLGAPRQPGSVCVRSLSPGPSRPLTPAARSLCQRDLGEDCRGPQAFCKCCELRVCQMWSVALQHVESRFVWWFLRCSLCCGSCLASCTVRELSG